MFHVHEVNRTIDECVYVRVCVLTHERKHDPQRKSIRIRGQNLPAVNHLRASRVSMVTGILLRYTVSYDCLQIVFSSDAYDHTRN